MEYRGYDSVGIATSHNNTISLKKGIGKVSEVNNKHRLTELNGSIGIGHTRWATHGKVTVENAHPHSTKKSDIAIVHNGIIKNYEKLRVFLEKENYSFKSETDSEVISNLIQYHLDQSNDFETSVWLTINKLKGAFSFIALASDGTLAAARCDEPLILGIGDDGYYISSDVLGFLDHTDEAIFVGNKQFFIIDQFGLKIQDFDRIPVSQRITKVAWEIGSADKGKFEHYTIKEIEEQPKTILKSSEIPEENLKKIQEIIRGAYNIFFTGSGTSYNSALVARQLFSKFLKVKIEPIMSSEFDFCDDLLGPTSPVIAISQSGESADVLKAISKAKKHNAKTCSFVNVTSSSLVRETDAHVGINCGPEMGVAATKSFTSQLVSMYKIVDYLKNSEPKFDFVEISKAVTELLKDKLNSIYLLGRGIHYPIALEGALKIKELAYIHAEGIPGGELKHGPLALIDENTFVISIHPDDETYDITENSLHEIKARGAKIIGISDKPNSSYDYWIKIPKVKSHWYPILEIIPLQLIAYFTSMKIGENPDYPRNLAKSVTVL
jgi:glucosamine--fructose-6-phosphate aminotransferase (isomerizing)